MSPSRRRRVGGRKKGRGNNAVEQNSSGDTGNRTLPTAISFRNLGQSPRVSGSQAILDGGRKRLPSRRSDKERLPSPSAVMSLLSVGVVPEERRAFRRRFRRARKGRAAQERRTAGSAGRSVNSWAVGHRSVWSQVPTGVSHADCVRLLTCSPHRVAS